MTTTTNAECPTDFLASLPWEIPITWSGRSGLHILDDDRRATLRLWSGDRGGQYPGVHVEITSKTTGMIKSQVFLFDDHLHDRADTRTDHPTRGNPCFEVIEHIGWRWYIAIPLVPEAFVDVVEEWIEAWR